MEQQPATYRPGTHSLAIVSLVMSILGLIGILPLVGSIGGVISGSIALKEIRERPENYEGEGLARAGVIMGWIGIALGALAILAVCALLLYLLPARVEVLGNLIVP